MSHPPMNHRRLRRRLAALPVSENRRRLVARSFCDAFTLTEVLIALAMVSLLLIGISRIFALTSATIGQGQALSTVMRAQRAINQTLNDDFLGVEHGPIDNGIMPINLSTTDGAGTQPAIIIANFRVSAFPTKADEAADVDYQSLTPTDILDVTKRGTAIRSDDTVGVTIPRYAYGTRSFRIDSCSFFSSGSFTRQTGNAMDPATATGSNPWSPEKGSLATDLTTNNAWIWYGHLRIFNGSFHSTTGQLLEFSKGYGSPGLPQTQGAPVAEGVNNVNNLYSSQFTLGRMQTLLKEPVDHDGDPNTVPTVVGDSNDVQSHVFRINTNNNSTTWWIKPSDNILFTTAGTAQRVSLYPLQYGADVRIFEKAQNANHRNLSQGTGPSTIAGTFESGRSDVAGVSAGAFRDRMVALYEAAEDAFRTGQSSVPTPPLTAAPNSTFLAGTKKYFDGWCTDMLATSTERPWGNPFPVMGKDSSGNNSGFSSRNLSQRSMIVAPGVSNFIVEFAGDFGTQNAQGVFTNLQPDGVIDFAWVNNIPMVRWYGMPRDIDEDGIISGGLGGGAIRTSPDVVPVRDVLGGLLPAGTVMPFEKVVPPLPTGANNYLTEPAANTAALETASYVCAWGPEEFDGRYRDTGYYYQFTLNGKSFRYRPWMVRIITDVQDETGKMREPLRTELVYRIPTK